MALFYYRHSHVYNILTRSRQFLSFVIFPDNGPWPYRHLTSPTKLFLANSGDSCKPLRQTKRATNKNCITYSKILNSQPGSKLIISFPCRLSGKFCQRFFPPVLQYEVNKKLESSRLLCTFTVNHISALHKMSTVRLNFCKVLIFCLYLFGLQLLFYAQIIGLKSLKIFLDLSLNNISEIFCINNT